MLIVWFCNLFELANECMTSVGSIFPDCVLVMSGPGSKPCEGHYVMVAILVPRCTLGTNMSDRPTSYITSLLYVLSHDTDIRSYLRIYRGITINS